VHDTCVKALTSGDSAEFASTAKLGAWLNRILVNTYRDQYRRSQRSPLLPHDYHATSDGSMNVYELVASTQQSPLQCMQNRDSSSAIQQALSALPPEVRVVSVLFLISELSYKEIAYISDCPLGTVMSRLARGRRLLRETLADFNPAKTTTAVAGIDQP
jgi:RNA polymerase sigma-70 factor (ECF subfamily)